MYNGFNIPRGVLAIRIYFADKGPGRPVMADLFMVDHAIETIEWTNEEQREKYAEGINSYTLIFDERPGQTWEEMTGN